MGPLAGQRGTAGLHRVPVPAATARSARTREETPFPGVSPRVSPCRSTTASPNAPWPTACGSSSARTTASPTSRSTSGSASGRATRRAGRTGFAHLFEHLMFQGSRNVAQRRALRGADGAGRPAERHDVVRPHQLLRDRAQGAVELALWLEADRHGHLLDAVTQENLDNQRDVVKEEKRQRYDNVPYGNALIDIYAAVFPEGHPYHHPTIGSMEDLDAASLEDVHAFFRRALRPQQHRAHPRAATSRRRRGSPLAERYFGDLPASAEPRRLAVDAAAAAGRAGARRARRGRARRPAAPRLPAAGRRHPRVLRRLAGDRRPRRPGDLPARTGGWSAASRSPTACRRHAHGASSTGRRWASSASTWPGRRAPTRSRRTPVEELRAVRSRRARPTSRWSRRWPRPSGPGSPRSPARRSAPTPSATARLLHGDPGVGQHVPRPAARR